MKIVYQNIVWLLINLAYNYLCLADNKNIITLGAFFDTRNSQAETALASAVYDRNTMQEFFSFNAKMEILENVDSFKSCKILCKMIQENGDMGGIFSPASIITSPVLQSISTNLEIPFIVLNWRPNTHYGQEQSVINFYPSSQLLSHGLAVIVKNLQWRSFVVLYQDDNGLTRLQDILNIRTTNKRSRVVVRQLQNGDNRHLLKEIRLLNENRIILDCPSERIVEILKQAQEVNLMESSDYNYFLTNLDAHTTDLSVLNTTANITTVRIVDPSADDFQRFFGVWQLQSNDKNPYRIKTEAALIYDAFQIFASSLNSLHLTQPLSPSNFSCGGALRSNDGFRVTSFMKIKSVGSGASGPIAFDELGHRTNFTIHVVEGWGGNVVAHYHPDNPESLTFTRDQNDSYDALMRNLRKGVLIISSRLGPPYLMERKPRFDGEILTGNARYEGYSMDLIDAIAGILGFKYEFRLTRDGKYGNYDPVTKSWNGLIRDLLDRKADLAICDLTITHQRREVVDFSMPFMTLGISILYKKNKEKDVSMFAFLNPFSTEIWIYTATLYLAVSLILFLVARMAPGDWDNPHPCERNPAELENVWNIKNCLWFTLGSIMTQGCDVLPKGISSRMASSMWWFFSLIMTSSYTANLAAFLTMERLEPSIDSAEALSKQTKIKYGTVEGGATQAFFRESNYSTYHRMWTSMVQAQPGVFEKNNADGVKRVQTTKHRMYAFLMESSQIEYEIETKCNLQQVGNWLDSKGYGIAMPLDYPYRSAINTAILKLQEDSKLVELKNKWWKKMRDEPSCQVSSSKNSSELALNNVGGVFVVLAIGVGVAFLLALVEFLWNVRKISIEQRISFYYALKTELVFASNVWITKKRVRVPDILY